MILCIEGPDATGKSTQLKLLSQRLQDGDESVIVHELPINGFSRTLIYRMLHSGWAKKLPTTFQLIHFINRFVWQTFELPFEKMKYDNILVGRWAMSSLIYGSLEKVSPTILFCMKKLMIEPDLTFVIHGPQHLREQKDSYESDDNLQANVARLYDQYSLSHERVVRISNEGTPQEVSDRIFLALELSKQGFDPHVVSSLIMSPHLISSTPCPGGRRQSISKVKESGSFKKELDKLLSERGMK